MHNPIDLQQGQIAVTNGWLSEQQAYECLQRAEQNGRSLLIEAQALGWLVAWQAQAIQDSISQGRAPTIRGTQDVPLAEHSAEFIGIPSDSSSGSVELSDSAAAAWHAATVNFVPPSSEVDPQAPTMHFQSQETDPGDIPGFNPKLAETTIKEDDRLTAPLDRSALQDRLRQSMESAVAPEFLQSFDKSAGDLSSKALVQLERLSGAAFQAIPAALKSHGGASDVSSGGSGFGDEGFSVSPTAPIKPTWEIPEVRQLFETHRYLFETEPHQGFNRVLDTRIQRMVRLVLGSSTNDMTFLRGALIMAQLDHAAIPKVHHRGQWQGIPFYTSDETPGDSLDKVVSNPKYVRNVEHLTRVFANLVSAVVLAHESGVVHSDINPHDILLGHHGEVWLTRWDQAVVLQGSPEPLRLAAGIERNAQQRQTKYPKAPEYRESIPSCDAPFGTVLIDVWALGMTLHFMLCKSFPRLTRSSVVDKLDEVELFGRPLPIEIKAITRKALAYDPENRYGSARELYDDVRRFMDGERVLAAGDNLFRVSRRVSQQSPIQLSVFAGLAVIVLVLSGLSFRSYRQYVERSEALQQKTKNLAAETVKNSQESDRVGRELVDIEEQRAKLTAFWAGQDKAVTTGPVEQTLHDARILDEALAKWRMAPTRKSIPALIQQISSFVIDSDSVITKLAESKTDSDLAWRSEILQSRARLQWHKIQLLEFEVDPDQTKILSELNRLSSWPESVGYGRFAQLTLRWIKLRRAGSPSPQQLKQISAELRQALRSKEQGPESALRRLYALVLMESYFAEARRKNVASRSASHRVVDELHVAYLLNTADPRPIFTSLKMGITPLSGQRMWDPELVWDLEQIRVASNQIPFVAEIIQLNTQLNSVGAPMIAAPFQAGLDTPEVLEKTTPQNEEIIRAQTADLEFHRGKIASLPEVKKGEAAIAGWQIILGRRLACLREKKYGFDQVNRVASRMLPLRNAAGFWDFFDFVRDPRMPRSLILANADLWIRELAHSPAHQFVLIAPIIWVESTRRGTIDGRRLRLFQSLRQRFPNKLLAQDYLVNLAQWLVLFRERRPEAATTLNQVLDQFLIMIERGTYGEDMNSTRLYLSIIFDKEKSENTSGWGAEDFWSKVRVRPAYVHPKLFQVTNGNRR